MGRYALRVLLFLAILFVPIAVCIAAVTQANRRRVLEPTLRAKIQALVRPDALYRLLILGDSRAEQQVDPWQLADELGIPRDSCLNLGVRAGDLSSAVQALRVHPELLRDKPTLIFSVSFFAMNDGAAKEGYYSPDLIAECSPVQAMELLTPTQLNAYYLTGLAELLGHAEKPHVSNAAGGFQPFDTVLEPREDLRVDQVHLTHPWYKGVNLDGIRRQIIRKDLVWIAEQHCRALIYDGPIAPWWKSHIQDSYIQQVDDAFTQKMAMDCAAAGVAFVSYHDRAGIPNSHFKDLQHLNRQGSVEFTRWLADTVRSIQLPASKP
jgi:hypothetical protein